MTPQEGWTSGAGHGQSPAAPGEPEHITQLYGTLLLCLDYFFI